MTRPNMFRSRTAQSNLALDKPWALRLGYRVFHVQQGCSNTKAFQTHRFPILSNILHCFWLETVLSLAHSCAKEFSNCGGALGVSSRLRSSLRVLLAPFGMFGANLRSALRSCNFQWINGFCCSQYRGLFILVRFHDPKAGSQHGFCLSFFRCLLQMKALPQTYTCLWCFIWSRGWWKNSWKAVCCHKQTRSDRTCNPREKQTCGASITHGS